SYKPMPGLILETSERIGGAAGNGLSGVPSGFVQLDKLTAGWQNSDMVVVAARPAMGKTSFVLGMVCNMAVDYKKAVAIFSWEMSSTQPVTRLIASVAGISSEKLRNGKLTDDQFKILNQNIARITNAPIYIEDIATLNIVELRAKAHDLKSQHSVDLII